MRTLQSETTIAALLALLLEALLTAAPVLAQEQEPEGEQGDDQASREEKALDSTATQWSFQFAWQGMTYHDDVLDNGQMRPAGNDNFAQVRIVAPFPFKKFTLLPRLTLRHYKNPQGKSGFGNTEIFGLIIPNKWDWGSGRFGIGPLITAPGDKNVSRSEWGYGFAMAAVNGKGKWFYGALLTQVWRAVDPQILPAGTSDANPLGIAPFLNYRLGGGWYVGNGDMIISYNWDKSEWYVPIALRIGKVIVGDESSWNVYGEYKTSLYKDDWSGTAVKNPFASTSPTRFRWGEPAEDV